LLTDFILDHKFSSLSQWVGLGWVQSRPLGIQWLHGPGNRCSHLAD